MRFISIWALQKAFDLVIPETQIFLHAIFFQDAEMIRNSVKFHMAKWDSANKKGIFSLASSS